MITCSADEFDMESVKETGAWQIWSFGPALLDNGSPKTEFVSSVTRANPRSAIGCVEPGHYVFVQVDGRIDSSRGMTMEELSQLFASLGCTAAYNLDGGQSAGFTFMGKLWSYPYRRAVWDIIYIGEA
jgi:exopolysaccharide biosynthesis protein